jgi:hypothetical protein
MSSERISGPGSKIGKPESQVVMDLSVDCLLDVMDAGRCGDLNGEQQ